jgi:hypothetical protein
MLTRRCQRAGEDSASASMHSRKAIDCPVRLALLGVEELVHMGKHRHG